LFSFFYPWPVTSVIGGNAGGNFVSNIGPLSIYFDLKSWNFTQGAQTISQSAFCVPSSTPLVFWVRVANSATDSSVTLRSSSVIQFQGYGVTGNGQVRTFFIVNQTTINPGGIPGIISYDDAQPTILQPATPNGPSSFTLIKFGASSQTGNSAPSFPAPGNSDINWITFIGFYYVYRGFVQGETIPFMDIKTSPGYPGSC
jgi:hypothetical protein